jgi:gamma-glutamylcyclotransferase (GGCT)/AIG2-like uncharacterized protein YtfP
MRPPAGSNTMTSDFFAYGTLMCTDIMQAAAGARFTGESGLLRHYRRRRLKGETYPGMIAARDEVVDGILYHHLSPAVFRRLDVFEGEMYARCRVQVETAGGLVRPAFTYVLRKDFEDRLGDEPWSLSWFRRSGKKIFEAGYFGFNALNT